MGLKFFDFWYFLRFLVFSSIFGILLDFFFHQSMIYSTFSSSNEMILSSFFLLLSETRKRKFFLWKRIIASRLPNVSTRERFKLCIMEVQKDCILQKYTTKIVYYAESTYMCVYRCVLYASARSWRNKRLESVRKKRITENKSLKNLKQTKILTQKNTRSVKRK